MSDKQIWQLDAVQLSTLLEAGGLTPIDLFEAFLDRFDRLKGALNAFAFLDRGGGRRAAEAAHARQRKRERLGPLDGIPISVKDNLYVAGLPAGWGSRLFRGHVPEHDDLCVERLRAAGAVIVGKSATAEFALSGRTQTRVLGTTRNPWNPALTPGGSSGGAVGDLELLFTTLAGPDCRDPVSLSAPSSGSPARPLRIGWFAQLGDDRPDEAVRASHEHAVGVLSRLGHRVEPCAPPFEVARLKQIWETLSSVGAARVALRFPNWEAEVTKPLAAIVERGRQRSAREYVEALDMLHEFRAETSAHWREYDALVLPTGAAPAWPTDLEHPAVIGGKPGNGAIQSMFCGWVNAVGYTGLSVPADPHVDGRPIGVQFVARAGGDEMLLSLARDFETAAPWAGRWPELAGAEA